MGAARGLVGNYSRDVQFRLTDGAVSAIDRDPGRSRCGGIVRARRSAGKTRQFVTMFVLSVFFLSTMFVLSISLHSTPSDRTGPVTPLGIIGDVSWTNMNPSISPGPRYLGAFFYDPPTDTFSLFGGFDNEFSAHYETWSYDAEANSWQNMYPVNPPHCLFTVYAYDPVDEVLLLYPCLNATSMVLNETWSYSASSNEWRNLHAANAPPVGFLSTAAYDAQSDKLVLFGGDLSYGGDPLFVNETWSYDFTSNKWTNLTPAHSPSPRGMTTMVYDSESDRIIMFGGGCTIGDDDILFSDTWSYDLDSNTWTNLTPLFGPSERVYTSGVYDPVSDRMLIFGGIAFDDEGSIVTCYDEMWEYDYNTNSWSEINQLTKPPGRAVGLMAMDPSSRKVVLYGGYVEESGIVTILGDTWCVQLGTPIPEFQTAILPAVGVILTVTAIAGVKGRTRRHRRS